MHRIDGPGATVDEMFTEGNPSLGIPATTVTDDIMNAFQEEIATVIEDAGLTLAKADNTQLRQAIDLLIGGGGSSQIKTAIANNTGPSDVTGVLIDKTSHQSAIVQFSCERFTDTQNVQCSGFLFLVHDTSDDSWRISESSFLDDDGVEFSVTSGGQLQFTSDDLTGPNYDGQFRATILRINQ